MQMPNRQTLQCNTLLKNESATHYRQYVKPCHNDFQHGKNMQQYILTLSDAMSVQSFKGSEVWPTFKCFKKCL